MTMKRRKYTEKFKADAVARMGKEPTANILKDLKIGNSVLYKWRLDLKGAPKKLKKREKPSKQGTPMSAIIYLRHARDAMNAELVAGKIKKLDKAHLLSLLALQALGGE